MGVEAEVPQTRAWAGSSGLVIGRARAKATKSRRSGRMIDAKKEWAEKIVAAMEGDDDLLNAPRAERPTEVASRRASTRARHRAVARVRTLNVDQAGSG